MTAAPTIARSQPAGEQPGSIQPASSPPAEVPHWKQWARLDPPGELFFAGSVPLLMTDTAAFRLDEGPPKPLSISKKIAEPIALGIMGYRLVRLGGVWPNQLLLAHAWEAVDGGAGHIAYELWDGDAWGHAGSHDGGAWCLGMKRWSNGRILTASVEGRGLAYQFNAAGGQSGAVPKPSPATKGARPHCETAVSARAFDALTSGHVFVVGARCDESGEEAMEHWNPGAETARIFAIPTDTGATDVHAATPQSVYVLTGDQYILRFDTPGWEKIATPENRRMSHLRVAPDATVWVRGAESLWRRPPGGDWSPVLLPAALTHKTGFSGLEVDEDGAVWVHDSMTLWKLDSP